MSKFNNYYRPKKFYFLIFFEQMNTDRNYNIDNKNDLYDDIDFEIKSLNPEEDLLNFLKIINIKLPSDDVKYPKVRKKYNIYFILI